MNGKIFIPVISVLIFISTSVFAGTVQLPQTGQTTSYSQGDDGELQTGVSWPDPRFTVGTGAEAECATDNLTGLMWPKNANLPNGTRNWQGALDYVASINSGAGLCGYTDWRLPNRKEIRSVIDYSEFEPALPLNNPFINVQSSYYWSSTTYADDTSRAWLISIWEGPFFGGMSFGVKTFAFYVWPVRSGQIDSFDYYCDEDQDNHKDSSITNSCLGSNCVPAGCQITPGDDCDDSDVNNWISCASCIDGDTDNYFINCDAYVTISGPDCNDSNSQINPDTNWYVDNDGDTYGNPSIWFQQCTPPPPPPDYVLNSTDCDDSDENIYPGGPPVRIDGTPPSYFNFMQDAYVNAVNSDIIQSKDTTLTENLSINLIKSVTFEGGYDCSYTVNTGMTTIEGTLTINDGTVTIENFKLQ